MFSDIVKIKVIAGKGGDGALSFLREKFRAKGGPDGGDGGKGGDIFIVGDRNQNTLYEYKTKPHIKAEDGGNGSKLKKRGRHGEDIHLKVPLGTVIFDENSGQTIGDIKDDGQSLIVAKGGDGGFGNAHFVSSVRQTPQMAEIGEAGEEINLRLEMKMIADVGLIGLPNAGKSTLLSVLTDAKPKIADYPFTTLIPNLGAVRGAEFGVAGSNFLIADIPGLIEGASEGKGLGDEFLRHVERTKVIVHLLDITSGDPVQDFESICKELALYDKNLIQKPQILVITKSDLNQESSQSAEEIFSKVKKTKKAKIANKKPIIISSVSHDGLKELIVEISKLLRVEKEAVVESSEKSYKVYTLKDVDKDLFSIAKEDGLFIITGEKIEKFSRRTDTNNVYAVGRLVDIMKRMGITRELRKLGAKDTATVRIADKEFKVNIGD